MLPGGGSKLICRTVAESPVLQSAPALPCPSPRTSGTLPLSWPLGRGTQLGGDGLGNRWSNGRLQEKGRPGTPVNGRKVLEHQNHLLLVQSQLAQDQARLFQ